MNPYTHLHVHSQFSLLDGAADIKTMMVKAQKDQMKAIALTDHGNMFGAFRFVAEANNHQIKPIVGCEFYMVKDRHEKVFSKGKRDDRFHQLLLAKNRQGYENLSRLCSLGYIEGFYSKYPRIDKELLLKYHEGIIATSCCLGAEVPQTILRKGEAEAEKMLQWWIDVFGEDYYIELQRHQLENLDDTGISQEDINQILIKWAKKYKLKVIATNDSHYTEKDDWFAHDILLCINTGEKISTPKGEGRGKRFGFPNQEFYFKTQAEMALLFKDIPEALDNTYDIVEKVEPLQLKRDILLPNYQLPKGFESQDAYLRELTFQGAAKTYDHVDSALNERLEMELEVIRNMGFSGYFLIVQDFVNAAKDLGVSVGPGRGSAAGSVVAYCTGITNIDPIRYDLLFERFLNPERVSMPDIDIDFDDEGRQKVIDYVVDKYGRNQVAQIVTYGTMAAKMAIKDVSRALELKLDDANYLAKLVPGKPGTKLKDAYREVSELRDLMANDSEKSKVLKEALRLEGCVRNTGIHAAGIIIAPSDLMMHIPVCTSKDADLFVTQFDGKVIEDAGMLKMDFLGLKTLTIIKDALVLIQKNKNISIDIDKIPLDDARTFELYQKGETIGTFQFESEGMRMYLKDLRPTDIEDLIAMNALYRPGPLQYIPVYINRKHKREEVKYAHPLVEPILSKTFGIMVYQEQIMELARTLAGYSLGGADLLRRAMGKKDKEKMAKEREKFVKGAAEIHQIQKEKAKEIFDDMEKFADYGFNRSHSAAYSVLAYQTAYLKANYPAEYMAAVLTHNMNNIETITFFIDEAKRMGLEVLGPDINESEAKFTVNAKDQIRFGLAAIKGTGETAVQELVNEKQKNGDFKDIYNFAERVNLRVVNKKSFESLAQAGAFDSYPISRSQYFETIPNEQNYFIEKLLKYGATVQNIKLEAAHSLFGEAVTDSIAKPAVPKADPWPKIIQLEKEKEVVGFYISGHPLDGFKNDLKSLGITPINLLDQSKDTDIKIAGIVSKLATKHTKQGAAFTTFVLEDYQGAQEISLFNQDHETFGKLLQLNSILYIAGRMQLRYKNDDKYEFKIKEIKPLDEVKNKSIAGMAIAIPIQNISSELMENLELTLQQNVGKIPLQLHIIDQEEKIYLKTYSAKYHINNSEVLQQNLQDLALQWQLIYG